MKKKKKIVLNTIFELSQGKRIFKQDTQEISPYGLYLWLKDKITEEDKPKENIFEYSNEEPLF